MLSALCFLFLTRLFVAEFKTNVRRTLNWLNIKNMSWKKKSHCWVPLPTNVNLPFFSSLHLTFHHPAVSFEKFRFLYLGELNVASSISHQAAKIRKMLWSNLKACVVYISAQSDILLGETKCVNFLGGRDGGLLFKCWLLRCILVCLEGKVWNSRDAYLFVRIFVHLIGYLSGGCRNKCAPCFLISSSWQSCSGSRWQSNHRINIYAGLMNQMSVWQHRSALLWC